MKIRSIATIVSLIASAALLTVAHNSLAQTASTFTSGTSISSAAVNAEFATKQNYSPLIVMSTGGALSGTFTGGTFTGGTYSGAFTGSLTGGASLDMPLAGGTMTGALTVPGVTNTGNETISGTLGVTGILSVGSTLNIGTGLAANANAFIKTPNGSNIILNPQGTAYTQVDSPLNVIGTISPEASGVWSGSSYAGNSAIQENTTWTGTSTAGGNPTAFNAFTGVDSVDLSGAAFSTMMWVRDNISSSAKKGGANALVVSLNLTGATGNASGSEYAGLTSTVNVTSGDNGTSGHFQSSFTAANPVLQLSSAALYTAGGSGEEIDVGFAALATTKIGLLVDQLSTDTTNATVDDMGIAIDAQSSGTSGFLDGLSFGRSGGAFPIKSSGTLIYGEGNGGAAFTVANGVDWHLGTFTGNSWNDGHITFTGTGHVIVAGTAPAISSCGGQSAADTGSTDTAGAAAIPASTTSCTITYATAFTGNAPFPQITPGAAGAGLYISANSVTGFTVASTSIASVDDFRWHVMQ